MKKLSVKKPSVVTSIGLRWDVTHAMAASGVQCVLVKRACAETWRQGLVRSIAPRWASVG